MTNEPNTLMERVISEHTGHNARISGVLNSTVKRLEALTGDDAEWRYGGFVVHCITCDEPLSVQW